MNSVTRVLVVDDSAYVRKVVSQMLLRSPFIEVVGTARDGVEALERVGPAVDAMAFAQRLDGQPHVTRIILD